MLFLNWFWKPIFQADFLELTMKRRSSLMAIPPPKPPPPLPHRHLDHAPRHAPRPLRRAFPARHLPTCDGPRVRPGAAFRDPVRGRESLPLLVVVRVRSRPIHRAPLLWSLLWTLTRAPPPPHLRRPASSNPLHPHPYTGRRSARPERTARTTAARRAASARRGASRTRPGPTSARRSPRPRWSRSHCGGTRICEGCVWVCACVYGQSRGARER